MTPLDLSERAIRARFRALTPEPRGSTGLWVARRELGLSVAIDQAEARSI